MSWKKDISYKGSEKHIVYAINKHSIIVILTDVMVEGSDERRIHQNEIHFHLNVLEFFLLLHYDYAKKYN